MDSDPECAAKATLLQFYTNNNNNHHNDHSNNQYHPHPLHGHKHHHKHQQYHNHHNHPEPQPRHHNQLPNVHLNPAHPDNNIITSSSNGKPPRPPSSLYPSVPTTPTSPMTHKPDLSTSGGSGQGGKGKGYPQLSGPTPAETLHEMQRRVARLTSYLYGLAVTVVVGAVLMVALVTALYAKVSHDVRHHSHQPKVGEQISKILEREELCVRCSEVRLGPSRDEEAMLDVFTKRDSTDGLKCCVERPAELLRLLELHIEKRYRQEMAKGNIKIRHSSNGGRGHGRSREQEKPSAHLMGYPQRQDHNQAPGRQFPIGLWIHEEDLAFTHHVTYRHGRIVVPEDGLYFVYSQVAFLEVLPIGASSNPSIYSTESPSLSHYLYRYNIIYPNGGEEKLVQNSITKCWGPNRAFGEYTSYLGAVFNLRQGDEVFVKVSNVTMMAPDPKSNYFGLFKV
ncbi:uncharacterized protein LOC143275556 [Babylonia areolata]|uniref:uncharacterized protein LOC143275556 n=1 Tax=Babylonia areolata TaxID=304850 RepID=UPI003FD619D9